MFMIESKVRQKFFNMPVCGCLDIVTGRPR